MSEATAESPHSKHYAHYYRGIRLDPYRIISVYSHIVAPEHQHALKKLLRCGQSDAKSLDQDIEEVIMSLKCWQRRRAEDNETEPS